MEPSIKNPKDSPFNTENGWVKTLLANSNEGILITDAQGTIVAANPASGKILKYPIQDILQKNIAAFFIDAENAWDALLQKFTVGHANTELFVTGISGQGESVKLTLKIADFPYENSTCFMVFLEDHTMQEELKKARELLNEAEAMAQLGSFELNLQNRKVRRSRGMYKLLGLSPQETEPTFDAFLQRLHPDDREQAKNYVEREISKGRNSYNLEQRLLMPDGSVKLLHSSGKVFYDEKNVPVKLVGISQDITTLRKTEAEILHVIWQEQEKERQRIAREIHDCFGPLLSGIKMYLEHIRPLLTQHPDESAQLEETLNNLDEIHKGLRDISHELLPKVLQDFGLIPSMENLCDKLELNSNLTVNFAHYGTIRRYDPEIEVNLYRIIQELSNNVVQHAQASTFNLQLVAHRYSLVMTAEDDGIGFDPQQVKLQEGIGLLNMKTRVKAMAGTISIDAAPGSGTHLTIEIPIP